MHADNLQYIYQIIMLRKSVILNATAFCIPTVLHIFAFHKMAKKLTKQLAVMEQESNPTTQTIDMPSLLHTLVPVSIPTTTM